MIAFRRTSSSEQFLYIFKALGASGCLLVLSSCQQNSGLSDPIKERIAVCSAGIDWKIDAGVEASLSKAASGGEITVALEQSIRGAIAKSFGAQNEQNAEIYKNYVECITSETARADFVTLLEDRRNNVVRHLISAGAESGEINLVDELMTKHINYVGLGNVAAAHEIYRSILREIDVLAAKYAIAQGDVLYSPQ